MNSLSDLNNASNKSIFFNDTRSPTLTFDRGSASNTYTIMSTTVPTEITEGINIETMVNGARAYKNSKFSTSGNLATYGLTYSIGAEAVYDFANIDISNYRSMLTIGGYELPRTNSSDEYFRLDGVSSGEMYVKLSQLNGKLWANVHGIKSSADWDAIKNFQLDTSTVSVTSCSSKLSGEYFTYDWTNYISSENLVELSTPSSSIQFDSYTTPSGGKLGTYTQIGLLANTALRASTYTCVVSTDDTNIVSLNSSGGSGGTSSWNGTTRQLTITGTRTQVNSHLNQIGYLAAEIVPGYQYYQGSFELEYSLYNNVTNFYSNVSQYVKVSPTFDTTGSMYLDITGTFTDYYTANNETYIKSAPAVNPDASSVTANVTSSNYPSSISSMTTYGSGGTSSWNNTSKTLTITGTGTQVNSHLANIKIVPVADFTSNLSLYYTQTYSGTTSNVTQSLLYGSTSSASNTTRNRSAYSYAVQQGETSMSTGEYLFNNFPPTIDERVPGSPTYNVTVQSSGVKIGPFGNVTSNTYTLTGATYSTVNSTLANLRITVDETTSNKVPLTLTITRSGTTIVNKTVNLNIIGVKTQPDAYYIFTSNSSFTPTEYQATKQLCDILLIGGGGTGATTTDGYHPYPADYGSGGGGGAGMVVALVGQTLPLANLTVTVGPGGSLTGYDVPGGNGGNTIIKNGSTILSSASGGFGGGGGPDIDDRWGGNYPYPGIPYSFDESTGNTTVGGTWWHHGGTSALYGGYGGGGGATGENGQPAFPTGNGPTAGIDYTNFYLIGKQDGEDTLSTDKVAYGGRSNSPLKTVTYPDVATGYGSGGWGATYGFDPSKGNDGIVIIRFY